MTTKTNKYLLEYFSGLEKILRNIDTKSIIHIINFLVTLKKQKGRIFMLGLGGSAANCSHAVNDFRKICHIEAYAPTDNVAELTARANDDGWETIFSRWLAESNLGKKDAVFVLSVGGGSIENNISPNIVEALKYAKSKKSKILGIVSRDGGYTKKVADALVLIPTVSKETITPYAETFQPVILHAIVNHPLLKDRD